VSILQSYPPGRLGLSFELFPPKSAESEAAMWQTVDDLVAWEPALITCTYGAGGSTRGKTLEILAGLRQRHGVAVASHLTCVGSTVDELRGYLREAEALGVTARKGVRVTHVVPESPAAAAGRGRQRAGRRRGQPQRARHLAAHLLAKGARLLRKQLGGVHVGGRLDVGLRQHAQHRNEHRVHGLHGVQAGPCLFSRTRHRVRELRPARVVEQLLERHRVRPGVQVRVHQVILTPATLPAVLDMPERL
jgi:hypothetical protein